MNSASKTVFYQGIDFDEVNGVNAFPFRLQQCLAFSTQQASGSIDFLVR